MAAKHDRTRPREFRQIISRIVVIDHDVRWRPRAKPARPRRCSQPSQTVQPSGSPATCRTAPPLRRRGYVDTYVSDGRFRTTGDGAAMSVVPSLAGANLSLPPLHNSWLGTLTQLPNPQAEPKSTCGDCVMCAGVDRSGSSVTFSPDMKCCTYVPYLANFVAGRSLLGPGRASVEARIARKSGVTPLALGMSHADIQRVAAERSQFGRSPAVVCPHFDQETKGCGIWETRNAVCSTWFCKHERGAVSFRFWQAVRDLLMAAEERVSHYCLTQGGLPAEQISAVLAYRAGIQAAVGRANAGETVPDVAVGVAASGYETLWGEWAGREEDWFRATADIAASMETGEFIALMADVPELSQAVADSWRDLNTHEVPDRLRFNPGDGSAATPEVLRLVGYSPFDPLVLPANLFAELRRLDGRPIAAVRADSDEAENRLDDNLLELLHDFEVAVPAGQRVPARLGGQAPGLTISLEDGSEQEPQQDSRPLSGRRVLSEPNIGGE